MTHTMRARRFAQWLSPKLYVYLVVCVKVVYVKMFFYVMPSSSLEGLAILYGLLFIVGMVRVPTQYRQPVNTEIIIWVLALASVLSLDWLIIYLTRLNLPTIAV